MTPRLLFIVGMQKSGTTVLTRLLEDTPFVARIARGEGGAYWGNEPPFSPTGTPVGVLYQQYGGERGHELDADDVSADVAGDLIGRLPETDRPILFNKSPYNTVRLPWLRAVFPEALVVAMVRQPVPNVFSLMKKYRPHEGQGRPPEDGWWGVKPRGWRDLVSRDKLRQSARQWRAVNDRLQSTRDCVDLVIEYGSLCREPGRILDLVLSRALGEEPGPIGVAPPLHDFDDEYKRGARLRSHNRIFRETGSLVCPPDDPDEIELPAFSEGEVQLIIDQCEEVAEGLELSR